MDTKSVPVVTPVGVDAAKAVYDSLSMALRLRTYSVLGRGGASGGLSGDSDREGADCQGSHDAGDDLPHGHNVSPWRGHPQ